MARCTRRSARRSANAKEIMVTVLMSMGQEMILDFKPMNKAGDMKVDAVIMPVVTRAFF